ncbi:hypothetical protein [Leptolyngbya sp. 7M]|uniref:hypothetical protein n=1 Tax=Leptolyngbya sp. 7M TaxID=2812896 RepID=UPI001B8BA730|nr:hypothetical protein [Leptolyngbya sp. 7M]QYO64630.1 hypothetical protein JVX88_34250 [Leptolyngbya sp. 7M]
MILPPFRNRQNCRSLTIPSYSGHFPYSDTSLVPGIVRAYGGPNRVAGHGLTRSASEGTGMGRDREWTRGGGLG